MSSQLFKFNFFKTHKEEASAPSLVKSAENILSMSDATFRDLRDVIYMQSGIYYTESKKYLLEGRISKRLAAKKFRSFEEYIDYLKSPYWRQEMNQLFEVITINETFFFRAEQQFDAFEKIVAKDIIDSKLSNGNTVFRVWSAACSTGEEPYTIAIVIYEKLKKLYPQVQFQILASDINTSVLDTARRGIFKEYAVKNIPEEYLKKYFKQSGNTYILNNEIKNMVKFTSINLYDQTAVRTITNCDVIFCCNVLIYFDVPSKQQVVSCLYDALNNGGYLFIGYSESLHGISKAFKLIHLPKAMAYKKE